MSHAYELNLRTFSGNADTDLSTKQYYAVLIGADENVILASDAGAEMIGVLQDEPNAADVTCLVAYAGITKAVGSTSIAAGAKVQVETGGKFKTYSSGGVAGYAMTACGGDGQLFSLSITRS